MSILFQYLVKLSLSLAVVWLFYHFVLRRLTFYNPNRWYLLGYSLLCFFIPFVNVAPIMDRGRLTEINVVQMIPAVETYTDKVERFTHCPVPVWSSTWDKWDWTLLVIAVGIGFFLLRFLVRCSSFLRLRKKATLLSGDGMKLYHVDDSIIPFSFGNSIFINRDMHREEELREIIRHEFVHVKQRHTVDVIWSEILCMINWYNPFAWLIRADLRQNLEFIADNKVLENGINKKEYQYLLLKVIGNNHFSIAQKFNFSSLKKRIAMMNKNRSARVHLLRFLFMLPLLAIILVSFRKQIGDTLKGSDPVRVASLDQAIDTVPFVNTPNAKGYYIDIIGVEGNCTVVVKDKNKKEVTRVLLNDWNKKEDYYEGLYGKIPPPPPPDPPSPPAVPMLPTPTQWFQAANPDVEAVVTEKDITTITLKDGKKEKYNLAVPAEKEKFEKKYGSMVIPPAPPVPPTHIPPSPPSPPIIDEKVMVDFQNKTVTVKLENGKVEKYDLTKPNEKAAFEKKYGKLPEAPEPPEPPALPVKSTVAIAGNDGTDKLASLCEDFEITREKALMHLKNGKTEEYDLTNTEQRKKFEKKYGRIIHAGNGEGEHNVAILNGLGTQTVLSPMQPIAASGSTLAMDDHGNIINGDEDILVTITKTTTRQQLEAFKKLMKEKGISLRFDNAEYDEKSILVSISGEMKSKDGQCNFSVTDFEKVVLSMVKADNKTYFKVHTGEKKVTI